MNRLLFFLLVTVFTVTGFASFAQKQTVAVNSIHKYKMGENLSTSKYLWRVTKKDGTDATQGTDYKFVVSYSDARTHLDAGLDPIAIAGNSGEMMDFSLAKANQNEVYVLWLAEGEYNISARVFDASSGCTDDTYNENTYGIILVGPSTIDMSIAWDVRTGDESDVEDCAVFGNNTINYTLSISGHRAPAKLDGSATPEELDKCKWKYKYEYIVTTSKTLPDAADAGWVKAEGTSGTAGDFIEVDFDVDEYNANANTNKSAVQIETILPPGDGQLYVWVKITDIRDGYSATYEGVVANMSTHAVINQIPVKQEIVSD